MSSEADRLDLYNGLNELLGPKRAETLMSGLSNIDISQLATKADLKAEVARLDARMDALEARMTSLEAAVVAIGLRLDKMLQTLVAGLFVIVAAMVAVMISV